MSWERLIKSWERLIKSWERLIKSSERLIKSSKRLIKSWERVILCRRNDLLYRRDDLLDLRLSFLEVHILTTTDQKAFILELYVLCEAGFPFMPSDHRVHARGLGRLCPNPVHVQNVVFLG